MTEHSPAEMEIEPPRRSFWRNLSVVWLVPVIAVVVSLGIAWQSYADRGVLVQLEFQNATGIAPGETVVKFREVTVGTVETVGFTADLARVIIGARIDKAVAASLPPDALFWVVRPQLSARGVSGLSTVLSGVYIDAAFTPVAGSSAKSFKGLEEAPLVRPGRQGTRITLRAKNGNQISPGAPVLYRGVEVGQLEAPRLAPSGDGVIVNAFIASPHDARLTTATRFWDLSGFAVSIGASGLKLDVGNLAALVSGGIAFDTIFVGGQPIGEDTVFDLFPEESAARESVFNSVGANAVRLSVEFTESVNGLSSGAAVMYRGLRVGEVVAIGAEASATPAGRSVVLRATIAVDPGAIGLSANMPADETLNFIDGLVADGLRAQLATTSIFSAKLVIELNPVTDAPPARLIRRPGDDPLMPSVESDLPNFTATAEGVLERVNALPIEEVMAQAISLMASIEDIAREEGTRRAPDALVKLLDETRGLIGKDDTQALPGEIRQAVAELRGVVADLRAAGTVDRLASAIASADKVAGDLAAASGDFPQLVTGLRDLAAKVNALPAEDLVASATQVLDSARALIGTDEARALPPALTGALNEVQAAVAEYRASGATARLTEALVSANQAAADVSAASADFPALVDQLSAVATKVDALPAEDLVVAATKVLESADALIGTEEARALPPALTAALGEVQAALKELREGGAVANTNAALASARNAADAVAKATEALPDITARIERLVSQAGTLVDAYGARSDFNAQTLAVLREVSAAARSVAQLARTIERNPNSLLIGR